PQEGRRTIGLYNVAIGLQLRFAAQFGVTPEQVQLEHVGLNHLSWERAVRVDGEDRLAGLIDADAAAVGEMVGVPGGVVRAVRALPSYYLRYYYMTDVVLREQLEGHTRAQDVMDIERQLPAHCDVSELDTKPELLERRGGAF